MAFKFFALACIRNNNGERRSDRSMPTYTKGVAPQETPKAEVSEAKAVFSVIGMTSSACAGSVEKAVKRLPGIREAVVDVLNNRAQVMFFPSFVNEDKISETIGDAGFEAKLIKQEAVCRQVCRISINGMTCTSCSSTVESALQAIHGVQRAQVALATEKAEVHYDPNIVTSHQLLETIENTGFEAKLISTGEDISKIELKVDGIKVTQFIRETAKTLKRFLGSKTVEH